MEFIPHGIYIVKDLYFDTFLSPNWMWNKTENRSHYLALQDASGMMWMVPMSSQVDTYRAKIERIEQKRGVGRCIYYHIGTIAGKQRVFIISGMFPVTPQYISHPYTIGQIPYIVRDEKLNRVLHSKLQKYLRLLEQHQLRDQNHVLEIRTALLTDLK